MLSFTKNDTCFHSQISTVYQLRWNQSCSYFSPLEVQSPATVFWTSCPGPELSIGSPDLHSSFSPCHSSSCCGPTLSSNQQYLTCKPRDEKSKYCICKISVSTVTVTYLQLHCPLVSPSHFVVSWAWRESHWFLTLSSQYGHLFLWESQPCHSPCKYENKPKSRINFQLFIVEC